MNLFKPKPAKPVPPKSPTIQVPAATVPVLYAEYGNEIRHYSTIRTSLTAFLVTVSLTAFAYYLNQANGSPFLMYAGLLFIALAVCAALHFSYRTERAVLRYRNLRSALSQPPDANGNSTVDWQRPGTKIAWRMFVDLMNWLLLAGVIALIYLFNKYGLPHVSAPPTPARFRM